MKIWARGADGVRRGRANTPTPWFAASPASGRPGPGALAAHRRHPHPAPASRRQASPSSSVLRLVGALGLDLPRRRKGLLETARPRPRRSGGLHRDAGTGPGGATVQLVTMDEFMSFSMTVVAARPRSPAHRERDCVACSRHLAAIAPPLAALEHLVLAVVRDRILNGRSHSRPARRSVAVGSALVGCAHLAHQGRTPSFVIAAPPRTRIGAVVED